MGYESLNEYISESGTLGRDLEAQMAKDSPIVEAFCNRYHVRLKTTSFSEETGKTEPVYVFDDDLGQYNIDALRQSLLE